MHEVTNMLIDDIKDYVSKNKPMNKDKWAYLKPYFDELQSCMTILAMMGEDLNGHKKDYEEIMNEMGEMTSGTHPYYRQPMMNPNVSYSNRRGMRGNRYGNGYSGHGGNQVMLDNLYNALDEAESEQERRSIQECINKLER